MYLTLSKAEDIQTLATKRSKIVLPLVHCLLGINGSPKFDRVTRTKIVENLLTVAEPEDVADYANSLLTDLKNPAQ
jgi:DNA polymerase phi